MSSNADDKNRIPSSRQETRDESSESSVAPTQAGRAAGTGFAQTEAISDEQEARAAAAGPSLRHDDVVAGRYRVEQYLARGGMGEVYEAVDLDLKERVALKIIREERREADAEERFRREVQLARKVTHPNVCRIFDVGFHVRDDGDRMMFLTMELLAGETLSERIRRSGPLSIADGISVLHQMAAGLHAAHNAGVLHRDFKSGNVLLVPRDAGAVRAVVTDFGLANVLSTSDAGVSVTGSGGVVGTPGYMAPEQVEGTTLSARTDVYALGVVMFEMMTGRMPFEGGSSLSIATRRLTQPAPSAKKLRTDLPAVWERAIAACLLRDPLLRPASPRAVTELFDDQTQRRFAKLNRRIPIVRPLLALTIVAVAVLTMRANRDRSSSIGAALLARGVTVGTFTGGDEESIAACVAARTALRADLLGTFPLVETQIVVPVAGAAPITLGLAAAKPGSASPLRVDGRCTIAGAGASKTLELNLRVVDGDEARVSLLEVGPLRQMSEVIEHTGDRIRAQAKASMGEPRALDAAGHAELVEIRHALDAGEPSRALDRVEALVVREPNAVEPRIVEGLALRALGLDPAADVVADRAAAMPGPVDAYWAERLAIDRTRADLGRRVELAEALRARVPADLGASELLAKTYAAAQRCNDARKLVDAIPVAAPADAQRRQLIRLDVAEACGDEPLARRVVDDVLRGAVPMPLPGVERELVAASVGPVSETQTASSQLATLAPLIDARARASRTPLDLVRLAAASFTTRYGVAASDEEKALALRTRALALELGNRAWLTEALGELSMALADGDDPSAQAVSAEALAIAGDEHEHVAASSILTNLAVFAAFADQIVDEARYLRRSLELARDSDDRPSAVFSLCALGRAELMLGEHEQAERAFSEASSFLSADFTANVRYECEYAEVIHLSYAGKPREATEAVDRLVAAHHFQSAELQREYLEGALTYVVDDERWDETLRRADALDAPSRVDHAEQNHALVHVYRALAMSKLGKRATTPDELAALSAAVRVVPTIYNRSIATLALVQLYTSERVARAAIEHELDRLMQIAADGGSRILECRARLERLRLLAREHDASLAEQSSRLVVDATRYGFFGIASTARRIGQPR